MKTIAFLLHNNFEQAEYEEVNNQLKDKGYKTLLITTNKEKEVQAMQQDVDKGDTFIADIFAKRRTAARPRSSTVVDVRLSSLERAAALSGFTRRALLNQ